MITTLFGITNPKIIQIRLSIADSYVELSRLDEAMEQEILALKQCKDLGFDQNELTKLIRSIGTLPVRLMEKAQMEESFALNEKI